MWCKVFVFSFLMLFFCGEVWAQFPQMGSSINGEAIGDWSGSSVSLSADGNTLAITAFFNDGNGTDAGHVRIYKWNGNFWVQKGNDIDGEAAADQSGASISLSADGNIIAIGAPNNSGNGAYSGHVRIYEWNGTAWVQKGNDIDGEAAGDYSGSVSLSADGNTLAIGAAVRGHVRIYEWNGTTWTQKGNDIDGEVAGDYFGSTVSFSTDGNTLAIGAPYNDGNGTDAGHVRIYEWNGTAWIQKGNDIDGEAANDVSGRGLSLSANGNILAIGAVGNGGFRGHVRIYEWSGTTWVQKGNDIDGETAGDGSGGSVSLSADGNILAIGALYNSGNGSQAGHVRIYEWNGSAWLQKGNDIDGETAGDWFGSVCLSADGNVLAIGAAYSNGAAGQVRVFNFKGLYGYAYQDFNQNCIQDTLEIGLANRMFLLNPGNLLLQTNNRGNWFIDSLPIGTYTLTADTSSPNWQLICPVTQSFTITNPDTATLAPSFGYMSNSSCPAPGISIHAPFLRPGFINQRVYIQACNDYLGTDFIDNAYVIVELDPLLTAQTGSMSYTSLGNNQYQINIDTLYSGQCVDFWLGCTLSTNAILNQTLCISAELYPQDSCAFDAIPNPYPSTLLGQVTPCTLPWDGSSLRIDAACVNNDSVRFIIYNTGLGMNCFAPVRIYLDGQLIQLDSIQLAGGDSTIFMFAGNAQTWRLEADQHPLHPGNSQPNATIENCGTGSWTPNLVNILPMDDADPIIDIYCGLVTGSYDPNDKTGYPLGVGNNHDILPFQDMEYVIRFQNTGTDTAFTIVIRDTLSMDFNIFSVRSGVSSHDYSFKMYGPRVLEWTFNNIMLPDSNVNEPASHGFVKFKVHHAVGLTNGTVTENSAAIYFDFNPPIFTNTSWHTINDYLNIGNAVSTIPTVQNSTKVYPNPTSGRITLQIEQRFNTANIQIINTLGQVVLSSKTSDAVSDLMLPNAAGIYFVRVEMDGVVQTHKVVRE